MFESESESESQLYAPLTVAEDVEGEEPDDFLHQDFNGIIDQRRNERLTCYRPIYRYLIVGAIACVFLLLGVLAIVELHLKANARERPEFMPDTAANEKLLLTLAKDNDIDAYMRMLTSHPHPSDSPGGAFTLSYITDKFREFGLHTTHHSYQVLISRPVSQELLVVDSQGDVTYQAELLEPPIPGDGSVDCDSCSPPFFAYSPSGECNAPIVYAHYGRAEDYELLESAGISVEGRAVLVRLGKIFRGVKVSEAQRRNALAVLMFSDPADGGSAQGEVYPQGVFRPDEAVARGNVRFGSVFSGDSSTPGWASVEGTYHLDEESVREHYLPRIPVLPVSATVAVRLMQEICATSSDNEASHNSPKQVTDPSWIGGLNTPAYCFGPSENQIRLRIESSTSLGNITNVIGHIDGADVDRLVVLGNHYDAWVRGAGDPSSGTAVFLETARQLAHMFLNEHWQPERTIMLCCWDAEEYGSIGSTEWVEEFEHLLSQNAVVYINTDSGAIGKYLEVAGSPALSEVVRNAAAMIPAPEKSGADTLLDLWPVNSRGLQTASPLGMGSDYVAFTHHLGVSSLHLNMRGGARANQMRHTSYDTYEYARSLYSPDEEAWSYHRVLSQLLALLTFRCSTMHVLPFDFTEYASEMDHYCDQLLQDFPMLAESPFFDRLREAISLFRSAASALDEESELNSDGSQQSHIRLRRLNDRIMSLERGLLLPDGLASRPWYRHAIYAPALSGGYPAQTFPSIREALLADEADLQQPEVIIQLVQVAQLIRGVASYILNRW